MIKELNYYITTNRFSQIAEELETTVRSYAESMGKKEENELREKARKLCSSHLVSSGLRSKNNSFINIDAEFFEGGELIESNLNRFIKDVLKAHGYQKVLWEYMGTTGLMTEISKSAMALDGYKFENYLPAKLKEKETIKEKNKLNRNFNRLGDDSGFDWSRGYDPNYSVEKKGWFSDYDENGIWTRFVSSEEKTEAEKLTASKVQSIRLIKTEHGFMLYDPGMILLNPILLWYLTQSDEVYGGEESDTIRLVEAIKTQLAENGNAKITEIAFGSATSNKKESEQICSQYKALLGDVVEKKLTLVSSEKAKKLAEENIAFEKNLALQEKSTELQKKIASILKAKPQAAPEEISSALENGKTEIALDILEDADAKAAGFTDEEYQSFMERAAELTTAKRADFAKAAAVISRSWNEYKSCGKTKAECIELLFKYVKSGKESDFNYELSLKQVLENSATLEIPSAGSEIKSLEKFIKEILPQENQTAALEYLASLPEQPDVARTSVYKTLYAAVKNYLVVRMSTGMSIKELFDYAVKSQGGKLPKASFTPPVVGYISNAAVGSASAGDATGQKRIYFDGRVSSLFEELMSKPVPQKEVSLEVLQAAYEKSLSKKKRTVKLGFKTAEAGSAIAYDIGEHEAVNPLVLAVLKKLYTTEAETNKKLLELAKTSQSSEDFIRAVSKDFQIEYNFADQTARELFAEQNKNVLQEVLADYAEDFENEASKIVSNENYKSTNNIQIEPVFRQITEKEIKVTGNKNRLSLPAGYHMMKEKTSAGGVLEKITSLPARLYEEVALAETKEIAKKAETPDDALLSTEEKQTVKLLIAEMSENEKAELIHAAGEDWNNITPFLIKEFLWRKQNGRSVKNLSEEINAYEKLNELPQNELEKYLTSTAVNGNVTKIRFSSNNLSFNNIELSSVSKDLSNQQQSVMNTSASAAEVPVVKLTAEDKQHYQQTYGLPAEGLSPVVQAYIKSGEWKNKSLTNDSLSVQAAAREAAFSSHTPELPHSTIHTHNEKTSSSSSGSATATTGTFKQTPIEGLSGPHPSPEPISEPLKESLTHLAERRHAKKQAANEMNKLDRINANYEHDKAVLAKSEPLFAKNQFWDVGQAEGTNEMTNTEIHKAAKAEADKKIQEIWGL